MKPVPGQDSLDYSFPPSSHFLHSPLPLQSCLFPSTCILLPLHSNACWLLLPSSPIPSPFPTLLLSNPPFSSLTCHPPSLHFCPCPLFPPIFFRSTTLRSHTLLLRPPRSISLQLALFWPSPSTSNAYPINLYIDPLLPATLYTFPCSTEYLLVNRWLRNSGGRRAPSTELGLLSEEARVAVPYKER